MYREGPYLGTEGPNLGTQGPNLGTQGTNLWLVVLRVIHQPNS